MSYTEASNDGIGATLGQIQNDKEVAIAYAIPVEGPFDRVACDVMGSFPVSKSGNRYVVVFSEYLTKWCECFLFRRQKLLHTYIHTYNFICFSRLQKKAAYADVDLLKTYLKYLQHLIGLILQITLKYL